MTTYVKVKFLRPISIWTMKLFVFVKNGSLPQESSEPGPTVRAALFNFVPQTFSFHGTQLEQLWREKHRRYMRQFSKPDLRGGREIEAAEADIISKGNYSSWSSFMRNSH